MSDTPTYSDDDSTRVPTSIEVKSLSILIVDDDPEYKAIVSAHLNYEFPNAKVIDLALESIHKPPMDFDWSSIDCILLDHDLGAEQSGLKWLKLFARTPNFPPVVFLTGKGDEHIASRAIKFGAADYLRKRNLSSRELAQTINTVIAPRFRRAETTIGSGDSEQPNDTAANQHFPWPMPESSAVESPPIAGYRVQGLVGEGASSRVFLAERLDDGLDVVLKVLRARYRADAKPLRRFLRESAVLALLDSTNVVRIYDQGEIDGGGFIAMEYLPGGDLRRRMKEPVAAREALKYLREIAAGLATIHAVGIIHRDLKPANVMFRADGRLVLADFGLARKIDVLTAITTSEHLIGTPSYMSPEQIGGGAANERSDLYCTGVLFAEMLMGYRPYDADRTAAILFKHLHGPIPRLAGNAACCQPIVDALLAKNPEDRYGSATALIAGIDRLLATLGS